MVFSSRIAMQRGLMPLSVKTLRSCDLTWSKPKTQYDVAKPLRQFYQAEVLVPSPIAPDLILFPNRPLYFRRRRAEKIIKPVPAKPMAPPAPDQSNVPILSNLVSEISTAAPAPTSTTPGRPTAPCFSPHRKFKYAGEWVCQTGCQLTGEPQRPVSSCSSLIYATDANDSACVGNTELCMSSAAVEYKTERKMNENTKKNEYSKKRPDTPSEQSWDQIRWRAHAC